MYGCLYMWRHIWVHTCVHIHIYEYICIYIYEYKYIYICIYIYACVSVCVCVCVWVCVYILTRGFMFTNTLPSLQTNTSLCLCLSLPLSPSLSHTHTQKTCDYRKKKWNTIRIASALTHVFIHGLTGIFFSCSSGLVHVVFAKCVSSVVVRLVLRLKLQHSFDK